MEQTETPTVAGSKPQVENIVPSNRRMDEMIAVQIARETEKMANKEISALVAEFLENILQCTYDKERTGVRSVTYNVVE